jgi:hypothetical protein
MITRDGLKSLVMQLMAAKDGAEEKKVLNKLSTPKNDLADLDEEMHGKPNTPTVEDDDLPFDSDDELPDVPKNKKKGKK